MIRSQEKYQIFIIIYVIKENKNIISIYNNSAATSNENNVPIFTSKLKSKLPLCVQENCMG